MTNKNRTEVTQVIWGAMGIALFGLFFSGIGEGLTIIHFLIALPLMAMPLIATGFIWGWWGRALSVNDSEQSSEKAKRDRIEHVLRNLSDAELQALKDRFTNDEIDDEVLYAHLSEKENYLNE